jgi:selenide,water dikinase
LHDHQATSHPDLIVGFAGSDDAGVFRIDDTTALVQTVDFFTPIVDDPFDWGRIAAANALSDVYAMGGDPLTSLQLVGWPRDDLPMDLLVRVIEGGAQVMAEAGCTIVGGHSIDDKEPKYGFSVTGTVPIAEVMTNAAGSPGQILFLTKPLGTGIISTAIKNDRVAASTAAEAITVMTDLNDRAASAARRIGTDTATDVTGFGLLGHLAEIVRASAVSARLDVSAVPLLPDVRELAADGMVPGGTKRNLAAVRSMLDVGDASEIDVIVLADAQTSGGLLVAVDAPLADAFGEALADASTTGWRVGELVNREFAHGPSGQISLR